MTKSKNTKRALFASVISMLLCVTMLIGSTFAWFTDTVTTGVNTIQAGTLDIDLVDKDGTSLVGQTVKFVDDEGNALADNYLWEPGCRVLLQKVGLKNNGNLHAKYKVVISGTTGNVDLAEVIDVYEGETNLGTLRSFLDKAEGVKEGNIAPGETLYFGELKLVMQESADNDYQGKSISDIAITVYATQATVEDDSFDNQYDADAEYDANTDASGEAWDGIAGTLPEEVDGVLTITTAAEIAAFRDHVNEGNTYLGKTVKLGADIDLNNVVWTPIGTMNNRFYGEFDGDGHTVSNLSINATSSNQGLFGAVGGQDATIKNLTINNATVISTKSNSSVFCGYADGATITFSNLNLTGLVKLEGMCQTGTVLGKNPTGKVYASDIVIDVDEGSYVSAATNPGYYDYTGGVFGQVWGNEFKNITSNIDVIGRACGIGGISGGAAGTWENISCSGDVTVLLTNTEEYYKNNNESGNEYGQVYWWQSNGTIIGYHGNVTYTNCTSTGTITYQDTDKTSNEMTWINSDSEIVEDSRFGCSRWENDNTVTIND